MKAFFATIATIVVIGIITVGGYLGGWWLQNDSSVRSDKILKSQTERRTQINRKSTGYQEAQVDQILDLISEMQELDTLPDQTDQIVAQRENIRVRACRMSAKVLPEFNNDIAAFRVKDCN